MGFFKKSLSQQEIENYLEIIESRYAEYAKIYPQHNFTINNFKDRYILQLKSKGELKPFFESEIETLDKMHKSLSYKAKREDELEIHVNKIVSEMIDYIQGYPEEFIHERAGVEMKKLIGAVKFIFPDIITQRDIVPVDKYLIYTQSCATLKEYIEQPYAFVYLSYIELLKNVAAPISQIEAEAQKIFKSIAVAIKDIVNLLILIPDDHMDKPCALIEYIEEMLTNFRMEIFKGSSS